MFTHDIHTWANRCLQMEINEIIILLMHELIKNRTEVEVEVETDVSKSNSSLRRNSVSKRLIKSVRPLGDEDLVRTDNLFVGLGTLPKVLKFLRFDGMVPNRRLDWRVAKDLVFELLESKINYDKNNRSMPVISDIYYN